MVIIGCLMELKNFITHAISGDIAVVIARTGDIGDSHAMTAFVIEKGVKGFNSGKNWIN